LRFATIIFLIFALHHELDGSVGDAKSQLNDQESTNSK